MHRVDHAVGQGGVDLTVFVRPTQDLVVDIGDVAHVVHIITTVAQVPGNHIEGHQHPGMAQVAVVVNRHAAHIHAHLARLDGFELFLLLRQRVVDAHYLPPLPQESLRVTVRLNTGLPALAVSSWSQKK